MHPFTLGKDALQKAKRQKRFRITGRKHLLATAIKWKTILADNPHGSGADWCRPPGGHGRECLAGGKGPGYRGQRLHPGEGRYLDMVQIEHEEGV